MKTNFDNFNVGDSIIFEDLFYEYSSNDFDAVYTLVSKNGKIEYGIDFITAENGFFKVNIPFSETNKIPSGFYQLNISFTSKNDNFRKSYKLKNIKVVNLNEEKDSRSFFEIALENVRACLSKNANPLQKSYKYKDRELSNYDYSELIKLESFLSIKVANEKNAKKGLGKGFFVYTRYNKY